MSNLTYDKYEGCGNSFVVIDDRTLNFPCSDASLIRTLCHRESVDGLLLLQSDPAVAFRMRIFNADGGEAEACGNGLRCIARYMSDLGLTPYRIAMGNQVVEVQFVGDQIAVLCPAPTQLVLSRKVGPWTVHTVNTGVPHAVVFVPDVNAIDVAKEAPFLRYHPLFAQSGTNVNFVTVVAEGSLVLRTFERGVERETLACGTGAMAAAVVAWALKVCYGLVSCHTRGGLLNIEQNEITGELRMIGRAGKP